MDTHQKVGNWRVSARKFDIVVSKKTFRVLIASLAYALFVVFFPWNDIAKQDGWRDFDTYVDYFSTQGPSKRELLDDGNFFGYFTYEILWDEIVRRLADTTGEPAIALRLLSFFICMVWGMYLFPRVPAGWALLFLLNPTSVEIAMSGIRNGFAWSLVILGLMTSVPVIRALMFLVAPFVHASSAALAALYLIGKITVALVRSKGALIFSLLSGGVVLGLVLTVGNELLLGFLGDRRIGQSYVRGGGSVEQMVFWAILLFTQLSSGREYLRRNALVIGLLAWYLVMNPFIPWSYRIWGAFIPVVAVSIWNLPPPKRTYMLYLWLGYLTLWYLYWTKLFDFWYPI